MPSKSILAAILFGSFMSIVLSPLGIVASLIAGFVAGFFAGGFARGIVAGLAVWVVHLFVVTVFAQYFASFLGVGTAILAFEENFLAIYLVDIAFYAGSGAVGGYLNQ